MVVGLDGRITPKRNNNTPSSAGCMESMREIPVVSGRAGALRRIILPSLKFRHFSLPSSYQYSVLRTQGHC